MSHEEQTLPRARLWLVIPLALAGLLQVRVLGLGFTGPEMAALHGPDSTALGRTLLSLAGSPASALPLRILSLIALLLAASSIARATCALFGERYGQAAVLFTFLIALASPSFTLAVVDVRALSALLGLAAAGTGITLSLSPLRARLPIALALFVAAGFALGWTLAPLLAALLAVPYRGRETRAHARALCAFLAALAGAIFHQPLPPNLLITPQSPLPLPSHEPTLCALAFVPLILGFFLLPDRRRALLVCLVASFGGIQLAHLSSAASAPLMGNAFLVAALAIALNGLLSSPTRLPTALAMALLEAAVIASGLLHFTVQEPLLQASRWRTASLASIQATADELARERSDCAVFVLSESGDLAGFGQSLKPPFARSRVDVTVAAGEPALFHLIAEQRRQGALMERALLVLADPGSGRPLAPLAPAVPGWKSAHPGDTPSPKLGPTGDWVFSPPVPVHSIAGIDLELPGEGLHATVQLQLGSSLSSNSDALSFPLDVPPKVTGSPRAHIELPLPEDLELLLGPPLVSVTTTPPGTLHAPPKILQTLTRPSILEPAPSAPLDLSRDSSAPTFHVVFDPTLPRPSSFALQLNVSVPGGQLEFTASGPVPSGLGGDLTLTPTRFGPRQTVEGMAPQTWQGFLATGLAQSLERAGGKGTVTLWIELEGPMAMSTPRQVHSFLQAPP